MQLKFAPISVANFVSHKCNKISLDQLGFAPGIVRLYVENTRFSMICLLTKPIFWLWSNMEGRELLGQIRSSKSLPELLAHEESCRSRLTMQVESMYKMQKTFHRDQQTHVKHLKQRTFRQPGEPRRMQRMPRFGEVSQGSYNQHSQLGGCFQQVQHLDQALAMIQTKKDQLQSQNRQVMMVKPIQASGQGWWKLQQIPKWTKEPLLFLYLVVV